jgi:histidinol-phosphatase (PHP family)
MLRPPWRNRTVLLSIGPLSRCLRLDHPAAPRIWRHQPPPPILTRATRTRVIGRSSHILSPDRTAMIATYHNHSTWSDGTTPIADLIAKARDLRIDELGISDHWVLHPDGRTPEWSMDPNRLAEYVDGVLSFRSAIAPAIRLGLEVDYFPGQEDAIRDALAKHPFDYLIGSVHEVDGFQIDYGAEPWDALAANERNNVHRAYWNRLRMLAESRLFDIAAHLDLPKKFGHRETIDLDDEIDAALDAIAASGMVVELNTAGWHKPCRDGYPSFEIIRKCAARQIPVTISADAHEPDHLLRDFPRAAQRLARAGYDRVARFDRRTRRFDDLEAAISYV